MVARRACGHARRRGEGLQAVGRGGAAATARCSVHSLDMWGNSNITLKYGARLACGVVGFRHAVVMRYMRSSLARDIYSLVDLESVHRTSTLGCGYVFYIRLYIYLAPQWDSEWQSTVGAKIITRCNDRAFVHTRPRHATQAIENTLSRDLISLSSV